MVVLYSILWLPFGCTGNVADGPGVEVRQESTGVLALHPVDPDDAIATRSDGLYSLQNLTLLDPTVSPVVSAARFREKIVSTESELLAGDDGLLPSPLQARLPGPVTELVSTGTALWLKSDQHWWVYARGMLSEPKIDGLELRGLLVHANLKGVPVAWTTVPDGLIALADSEAGPVVVVRSDLQPLALAASKEGLWATTDKKLHLFDGERWLKAGKPPSQIAGNAAGLGIWARTDEQVEHLTWNDGLTRQPTDDLPGDWKGCDAAGRLWTLDDVGVARRAAANPVAQLSGLLPGTVLLNPQSVRVDVTHVDLLESVALLVDGNPVTITTDDQGRTVAVLDPVLLEPGDHEVVVEAVWADSAITSDPIAFTSVVTGPITWLDHVEPLYRDRCSICHDNGTETILIGKNEWINKVDQILIETEAGRMPIGSDPLDAPTIGIIRSWKDAGFP